MGRCCRPAAAAGMGHPPSRPVGECRRLTRHPVRGRRARGATSLGCPQQPGSHRCRSPASPRPSRTKSRPPWRRSTAAPCVRWSMPACRSWWAVRSRTPASPASAARPRTWTCSSAASDYERVAELMQAQRLAHRAHLPALAGQGVLRRRLHRPDLQLGQRRDAGGRPLVPRQRRRPMVLGVPVLVANVEDGVLSKAFIMERERYDGADVAHLLQAQRRAARLGRPAGALRPALARAAGAPDAVRLRLPRRAPPRAGVGDGAT